MLIREEENERNKRWIFSLMLPHYRYTHKHTHAISHSLSIGLPPSSWSSWVIEQFELIHPNLSSPSGVPETKSIECEQQSVLKTFLKNTHFNLKKIIRMTCQFISTVTKNIVFTARYWSLATVIRYRLWRKMENSQGIVGVCQVIAMQLLRYSECFLAHCYAAARVFWVVHTGKVKRSYLSISISTSLSIFWSLDMDHVRFFLQKKALTVIQ